MKIRPIVWLNTALSVPAGMSLYAGVRRGLERGQDFQWSGAHLTGLHVDPYRQYLSGDPGHRILLAQVPNYLQELYVLLLPIGAVRFESARAAWVVLNLLFLAWVVAMMRKVYALGRGETLLLLLLTLASTPFRIVLGNGQQSLLELVFFCLVFTARSPVGRGLALGLSYAKYSFSPVMVFYLAMRRQFRMLLLSLIPVALGLLAMWELVGGRLLPLSAEPMAVSRTGVTPGLGDVMSLVQAATGSRLSAKTLHGLMYGVALGASAGFGVYLGRRRGPSAKRDAPILAVVSLMLFTHLTYDYIFLMVPLAAGLGSEVGRRRRWAAATVASLWLALMFSGKVPDSRIPVLQIVVFCVLGSMLVLLDSIHERTEMEA